MSKTEREVKESVKHCESVKKKLAEAEGAHANEHSALEHGTAYGQPPR